MPLPLPPPPPTLHYTKLSEVLGKVSWAGSYSKSSQEGIPLTMARATLSSGSSLLKGSTEGGFLPSAKAEAEGAKKLRPSAKGRS